MRIDRFRMERTQSLYENTVRWNLSESGVSPLSLDALCELDGAEGRAELLAQPLKYPESNGSLLLRERIAAFYPSARAENVLVTNGCSEANHTTLWALLERGDRVAVMLPNYMQAWGLARGYAGRADAYRLVRRREGANERWALDAASLRRAVTRKTRVVVVTNPNNPTGAVLTGEEMDEIVRAAERVGAWILADEVYRGAEVGSGPTSPTFWGRSDRVIVTAGLSKAFGLPGLRIGWIVGPPRVVAKLWSYQDYTTLTPTMLSDRLARIAMEPRGRETILARTRGILSVQLPPVAAWVEERAAFLGLIPPVAGAIALVRFRLPIASEALFERLRREKSVLVTPGAHFGIGKYFRIGYGYAPDATREGLERVGELLSALAGPRLVRTPTRPRAAHRTGASAATSRAAARSAPRA